MIEEYFFKKVFNSKFPGLNIISAFNNTNTADMIDWEIENIIHQMYSEQKERFGKLDFSVCSSYMPEHKRAIYYNIVPIEVLSMKKNCPFRKTFYFDCDICVDNFPKTYNDYLKQYEIVKLKLL